MNKRRRAIGMAAKPFTLTTGMLATAALMAGAMRHNSAEAQEAAADSSTQLNSQAPSESGPVSPQTIVLKGTLKGRGGSSPVAEAAVIELPNRENNVTSNALGQFSITIPKSATGLLFRAPGFEDLEVKLLENGGLPENGNLMLEPSPDLVGVGIIRARRKTEISQQSLQRQELERIPGTGGDAVRSLQTLPSVLPAGLGSAQIVVRGSAPGDNRYFVDRLELPFVFHLGGLGTVVPSRMLDGIDLFAGGFSSVYADATGGIVQLRTENKIPERTSGQFELGLIQSSLYLEGAFGQKNEVPTTTAAQQGVESPPALAGSAGSLETPVRSGKEDGRIGYRAGFRRTYLEVLSPVIKRFSGDRATFITLPQATDYQFVLNGNHSKGTWQVYLLGAANRLKLAVATAISDTGDGKSKFELFNYFQTSGARYSLNLGNGLGLTFSPQQRYLKIYQEFFGNVVDITSNRFTFDVALDKRLSKELSLTVGVRPEFERAQTNVDAIQFPANGIGVFFDPDTAPRSKEKLVRDQWTSSAYVDVTFKPIRELTLNPGVVFQRGTRKSQQEIDPRAAVRYQVAEAHTAKAAWGYYSQRPQPVFDSPQYGNPDIKLERAIHYVAGLESKFAQTWDTDVQVYSKDMLNLVGNATAEPSKKYENNIKGRARGIEFFIKKAQAGRWYGWLSYGFGKAERRDPISKIWRPFDYDRPHSFNLIGSYKITGQWQLGSKFQFLSGQPYTKVKGGVYNQNTGRYRPDAGGEVYGIALNDGRVPNFYQLDARSDYDFLFDDWKLNCYLDITNITNRQNIVGGRWTPDYSKREYVYGTPIIPSVGVIASF